MKHLWKLRFFSPLLCPFALSFPVCCLKLPFSAILLSLSTDRSSAQLEGPCQATQAAVLCPFQHCSRGTPAMGSSPCWMSAAPKVQHPPLHPKVDLKLPGQLSLGAPWSEVLCSHLTFLLFCSEFLGFHWPTHEGKGAIWEGKRVIWLLFFFFFNFIFKPPVIWTVLDW